MPVISELRRQSVGRVISSGEHQEVQVARQIVRVNPVWERRCCRISVVSESAEFGASLTMVAAVPARSGL